MKQQRQPSASSRISTTSHVTTTKRRLSASIDADLLTAAERAVAQGHAPTVSAWVTEAFERQIAHDQRLLAMDRFLAEFEAEFGVITEADIAAATLQTRAEAVVVRARPSASPRPASPKRKTA
jgi:hypothetical protein